jgi:hypothetical protein
MDGTLILLADDVGLLQHPGMFSILIGDFALFILCTKCAKLTRKIGAKLPNQNRVLVRRYFRLKILRKAFSGDNYFFKIFIFCSLIGTLSLINQSIKLLDSNYYYGHDTFDSINHIYSFAANRINLFLSWCIVIPLFIAYFSIHIWAVNRLAKKIRNRNLLSFYISHPDRSGGYAFFGSLNILYMLGLTVILLETIILIYTHKKIDLSNAIPLLLASIGFILISFFAVYEIHRTMRQIEIRIKARGFLDSLKTGNKIDLYYFTVLYNINFSAYNQMTARLLFSLRVFSLVPAIYKIVQYS